ncbi:hypothetical protein LTR08_000299 [Meristemomyces frigidus]|nr:hypothetical protein LTR08_000299 [Meristemomyces frigidus]
MDQQQLHDQFLLHGLSHGLPTQTDLPEAPQCNLEDDSESTPARHSSSFSFPTLSPDGSIDDISALTTRAHPPTPPAALSSLGAKAMMANHDAVSESESFADNQYDMLDDMSEASNDDHDTASLASTERGGSEDDLTVLQDVDTVTDEEQNVLQHLRGAPITKPVADFGLEDAAALLDSFLVKQSMLHSEEYIEARDAELDSFLSEDLDTPRQSTLPAATGGMTADHSTVTTGSVSETVKKAKDALGNKFKTDAAAKKAKFVTPFGTLNYIIVSGLVLLVSGLSMMALQWSTVDPILETGIRREALLSAFDKLTNSTDATKILKLDHLVPMPTATSSNFLGQNMYGMPYASYFQGAAPNHIIISLTKVPGQLFHPSPKAVRVHKGGRDILYNQTSLITGVYDLAIDLADAYGVVDVQMLTKNPSMNFSMSYNFGKKMLQRKTYENVGTELSKSVTKDLVVARDVAKSLSEKLRLEISAGAVATKNVTTQLVVYMARDLQIFTHTAASFLGKIGQASNNTTAAIRKDLVLATSDLVAFGRSVKESVSNCSQAAKALVPSKKIVLAPLKLSSQRAVGFKQKLLGSKKVVNNISASKELSTYFHDLFKTAKKPSKLRDIARCLRARDYGACRKAHQVSSMTTSLHSTIIAKGLPTAQAAASTITKVPARDALKQKREREAKWVEKQAQEVRKMQAAADQKADRQRKRRETYENKMKSKAAKLKRTA